MLAVMLWIGLARAWFGRAQRFYLARHHGATFRLGVNNYFLTVSLSQPMLLVNGAILLAFAEVGTVISLSYGIPAPLGFAIFAVSSPWPR
jgi:hypothetical protein